MMKMRICMATTTARMMSAARVTPLVAVLVEGDERVRLLRSPEMGSSRLVLLRSILVERQHLKHLERTRVGRLRARERGVTMGRPRVAGYA
jgi:hypothetical protein